MAQPTGGPIFSLIDLERQAATEIGKLSAEALVREYEAAAKDIEGMGVELMELVKQCEAMTRDALAVTEEMKGTATRYREEAKRVFRQIEGCSLITEEVRKTCTDLKERIATRNTVQQHQTLEVHESRDR